MNQLQKWCFFFADSSAIPPNSTALPPSLSEFCARPELTKALEAGQVRDSPPPPPPPPPGARAPTAHRPPRHPAPLRRPDARPSPLSPQEWNWPRSRPETAEQRQILWILNDVHGGDVCKGACKPFQNTCPPPSPPPDVELPCVPLACREWATSRRSSRAAPPRCARGRRRRNRRRRRRRRRRLPTTPGWGVKGPCHARKLAAEEGNGELDELPC